MHWAVRARHFSDLASGHLLPLKGIEAICGVVWERERFGNEALRGL
jgi:hypothetical protein